MLTEEERKWIEENDILDRHIFGHLMEEEAARFQFLLDRDPSFLEEMEFNTAIVAAIRQNGRLEMKQRLQEALKEEISTPAMSVHRTPKTQESHKGLLLLKIAAAVLLLIGGSVIVYQLYFTKPIEAPIADQEERIKQLPAQTETPKEEVKQQTVPDESKKIAAKKSTTKQKADEKPMIAATPPENLMQKHNQKFRVETYMMPKPNEVNAKLMNSDSKTEQETVILFKNPTDLVAVGIQETHSEDNGKLKWFFVVYENHILNVYIDNSKYLTLFRNAQLTENTSSLQIAIKDASYIVDIKSTEKFKKAVIKP